MVSRAHRNRNFVLASVLLMGGLVFAWARTSDYAVGANASFGGPRGGRGAPDGELRAQLGQDLELSEEQLATLDAMAHQGPPSSPEEARAHFERMQDLLTPGQQQRMREQMRERLLSDPDSPIRALPRDEQEAFLAKMDKRMKSGEMPPFPPMMGRMPGMR